jgi:hypothetical protein
MNGIIEKDDREEQSRNAYSPKAHIREPGRTENSEDASIRQICQVTKMRNLGTIGSDSNSKESRKN